MNQDNIDENFVSNLIDGHEKNANVEDEEENTIRDLVNSVAAEADTQPRDNHDKQANLEKAREYIDEGMGVRDAVEEAYPNADEAEVRKYMRTLEEEMGYDHQGTPVETTTTDQEGNQEGEEGEEKEANNEEKNEEKEAGSEDLNVFEIIQKEAQNAGDDKEDNKDTGDNEENGEDGNNDGNGDDSNDNGDNDGGDDEGEKKDDSKESELNLFDLIYKDAGDYKNKDDDMDYKNDNEDEDNSKDKEKGKDEEDDEDNSDYTDKEAAAEAVAIVASQTGIAQPELEKDAQVQPFLRAAGSLGRGLRGLAGVSDEATAGLGRYLDDYLLAADDIGQISPQLAAGERAIGIGGAGAGLGGAYGLGSLSS